MAVAALRRETVRWPTYSVLLHLMTPAMVGSCWAISSNNLVKRVQALSGAGQWVMFPDPCRRRSVFDLVRVPACGGTFLAWTGHALYCMYSYVSAQQLANNLLLGPTPQFPSSEPKTDPIKNHAGV